MLTGCVDQQSAMAPRGPHAAAVDTLSWIMIAGATAIFILVMVFAAIAIFAPPHRRRWMTGRRFVLVFGVAFPIVVLTPLLAYGLTVMARLADPGEPGLRIEVTGLRWWWRVAYLDADGRETMVTANEIRIPTGMPVRFDLKTEDVIHSFWVPALAGKLDMIPGRVNSIVFAADQPGVYRGQCAEYCGQQHALMAFVVVAEDREAFEAWYAGQARPAQEPTLEVAAAGARLFREQGCGGCHTVRGTGADGTIGPDLTHVGSRLTIAAASWTRNVGTLAGWIASAQHLKPDNGMPSFDRLTGPELRALAVYLEGLK